MFRIAAKLSSRVSSISHTRLSPLASSSSSSLLLRSFNTGLALEESIAHPDVIRCCNYALTKARADKSVGSYDLGYMVLKQCLTTELTEGNDPQHENSKGISLLALSTLLSERGNPGDYDDSIERLQDVQELSNCYLGVKIAAFEALAGLYLEHGKDDKACEAADKCLKLVEKEKTEDFKVLNLRARALKGLVELANGNVQSAEAFFDKSLQQGDGAAALSYGEYLQAKQNYSGAREVYQSVIDGALEMQKSGSPYLGACNMNLEGLMIGAMCALGQIESHLGNYDDAEAALEKALSMAEETYGEKHPKVAVVLTSLALMYRRRAIGEKSSTLLVEEGLYRRVIEILKVPEAESEGATPSVDRRDIAALARGAYAELLCVQENRKGEGEKLKNLAESIWSNRRMSLSDALGNTEGNLFWVIDAHISRLL